MSRQSIFKEGNGIVYHYTSVDTLFKILDGIENDHLVFHGSEIFCMNDPTEFYHGIEQIWKVFPLIEEKVIKQITTSNKFPEINRDYLNNKYLLSSMWGCQNCGDKGWIAPYVESVRGSRFAPFVISFSCVEDFLPMWENYGNKGFGVAIGIDIQEYYRKIQCPDGTFMLDLTNINSGEKRSLLVSYDELTTNHPLASFIHAIIVNYYRELSQKEYDADSVFDLQFRKLDEMMMTASCLIKNKAYEYEQESRLLSYCNNKDEIKYRTTSNKAIIPYVQVNIPLSKLKNIVVGPCCDYPSVKHAIKTKLEQLGISFENENIRHSCIPYRVL